MIDDSLIELPNSKYVTSVDHQQWIMGVKVRSLSQSSDQF